MDKLVLSIKIYINCFDLSDSDLVSRWGGPFQGHKWLSETPKCVHEMHWIVFCTCVCMYVYIYIIIYIYTCIYIHVFFYMIVWYSMCICISYIYVFDDHDVFDAVCCCQLPGPVQLENVKEQYLKHHGHKCLGTEETDETFVCSDILLAKKKGGVSKVSHGC